MKMSNTTNAYITDLVPFVIIFFQIGMLRLYFAITKYLPDTDEY